MTKYLRSPALLLMSFGFGAAVTYGAFSWRSDPQGESNASCDKFAEMSVLSGKGMTVSSHTTACTTLGTSVVSYVYVHPSDQHPAAQHLVFRYSQSRSDDSLKVVWVDDRRIVLNVGHVSQITKIQTTLGLILIDYKIGGG